MRARHERTGRAIVALGSYVLLCRGKGASFVCVPGGHCEAGEHPADTVRREMQEEMGREVTSLVYLATLQNDYDKDGVHIQEEMALYRATLAPRLVENPPQSQEDHLEFVWVPVVDLPLWPVMPPAVVPYLQFVGGT